MRGDAGIAFMQAVAGRLQAKLGGNPAHQGFVVGVVLQQRPQRDAESKARLASVQVTRQNQREVLDGNMASQSLHNLLRG